MYAPGSRREHPTSATRHPPATAHALSMRLSVGQVSYIWNLSSKARTKDTQVDPCLIMLQSCKNLHDLGHVPAWRRSSGPGPGATRAAISSWPLRRHQLRM